MPFPPPNVRHTLAGILVVVALRDVASAAPADAPSGGATAVAAARPIDESPLPIEAVQAFPDLVWTG